MRRFVVMLLVIMTASGVALASEMPDWVPEGFSYYEEAGFQLYSAYPMTDGGVVLAGCVTEEREEYEPRHTGVAVRLSEGGEVLWRHELITNNPRVMPQCDVYGVLADGRVLLACSKPEDSSRGYAPGRDVQIVYKAIDDDGREEILEELMLAVMQAEAPMRVQRVPEGFVLAVEQTDLKRSQGGEAVALIMLDDEYKERWRADLSEFGTVTNVTVQPIEDGYCQYGNASDGDKQNIVIGRLDAGGKVLWSLVDEQIYGWEPVLCAMPDGGVAFRSTYSPEGLVFEGDADRGTLWPIMQYTRLDGEGKHLWTQRLKELKVPANYMASFGDGIVLSGFAGYGETALALLSGAGDVMGVWDVSAVDENKMTPQIWMHLAPGADNVLLAAGSVEWEDADGERLPSTGVLYRVLDEGLFE